MNERRARLRRALGWLGPIALLLLLLFLPRTFGGSGMAPASAPLPSPPAAPSGAAPTTRPSSAPTGAPDLAAMVSAVEAQVSALRELAPLRDVPTEIVEPAAFRTWAEGEVARHQNAELTRCRTRVLVRLGLAEPTLDLRRLSLDLLSSQVVGRYDPTTRSLTVVNRGAGFLVPLRITVAHEYTHALQDQHFGFATLRSGTGVALPVDRELALQALADGDASLLVATWMRDHVTTEERGELERLVAAAPAPAMPPVLARQITFPYVEGAAFAQALYDSGGWAAVDAAYARAPASTAEILHPERYLAGWRPITVEPLRLAAPAVDDGWHETCRETLGELGLQAWLGSQPAGPGQTLRPADEARALAEHWTGDEVTLWEHGSSWVLGWTTAWDSDAAGASFAGAAAASPAELRRLDRDGVRVTLRLAADAAALELPTAAH